MKPLTLLCTFLIAYGVFVYLFEAIEHHRASATGRLVPFDEDGERVLVPGLGTVSVGVGVFLLVLGSTRRG